MYSALWFSSAGRITLIGILFNMKHSTGKLFFMLKYNILFVHHVQESEEQDRHRRLKLKHAENKKDCRILIWEPVLDIKIQFSSHCWVILVYPLRFHVGKHGREKFSTIEDVEFILCFYIYLYIYPHIFNLYVCIIPSF